MLDVLISCPLWVWLCSGTACIAAGVLIGQNRSLGKTMNVSEVVKKLNERATDVHTHTVSYIRHVSECAACTPDEDCEGAVKITKAIDDANDVIDGTLIRLLAERAAKVSVRRAYARCPRCNASQSIDVSGRKPRFHKHRDRSREEWCAMSGARVPHNAATNIRRPDPPAPQLPQVSK